MPHCNNPGGVISGDSRQPLSLDKRQKFQGRTCRVLLAPLPLADRIFRHVQIMSENCLAHLLTLAECLYFFSREVTNRRQASFIEISHSLFVDHAGGVIVGNSLVNSCKRLALVCSVLILSHLTSPPCRLLS